VDKYGYLELIITALGSAGLGGVVAAWFQSHFEKKKDVEEALREEKRKRYGAIIIQMLTVLDPHEGLQKTQRHRPDLTSVEDFKKEVRTEILNSIAFASDDVIKYLAGFMRELNYESFIQTIKSMRKDLWGKSSKVKFEDLKDIMEIKTC
jgi:hypothetical protein